MDPTARTPIISAPAPQPEHTQGVSPDSGESNAGAARDTGSQSSSTNLLHAPTEARPTPPRAPEGPYADFERVPAPPPPARSRDGHVRVSSRLQTAASHLLHRNTSGLDWIVPVDDKGHVSTIFVSLWIRETYCTITQGAPHSRRAAPTDARQCRG